MLVEYVDCSIYVPVLFVSKFSTIIGLLLTAEMASGAAAFVFRSELKDFVEENGVIMMRMYNESKEDYVKEAWDLMHHKLVREDNSGQAVLMYSNIWCMCYHY